MGFYGPGLEMNIITFALSLIEFSYKLPTAKMTGECGLALCQEEDISLVEKSL